MNQDMLLAEQDKLIVTQANALARSHQTMTLLEKRLILLTISHIRHGDDDFKLYQLPVATIRDYLGLSNKDMYNRLEEIANKLLTRIVTIKNDDGDWQKFQWVSECNYHGKKKDSDACIKIQLHNKLRPLLLNLQKHFGSVPLLQIASMPSVNSIRIFEILWFSSMQLIKKELVLSLEDLKNQLGVSNNYKNFAFFRRDVLERAQKDCTKHTLLTFTWKPEKKGRKVIAIRFFLQTNKNNILEAPIIEETPKLAPPVSTENPLIHLLKEHGVTEQETHKLIEEYPKERIQSNIELVRQKFAAGKVAQSALPAYTVKAIRENWWAQQADQSEHKLEQINTKKRSNDKKDKLKALEEQFNQERKKAIDDLYDEVSSQLDIDAEKNEFVKNELIKNPAIFQIYQKRGFESNFVKNGFRQYLVNKYLKGEFRSFETWREKNERKGLKRVSSFSKT